MSHIRVVISEIQPNKLKVAKSLKSGITFVEVWGYYSTCLFWKIKKILNVLEGLQSFHTSFLGVNRKKKFHLLRDIQNLLS